MQVGENILAVNIRGRGCRSVCGCRPQHTHRLATYESEGSWLERVMSWNTEKTVNDGEPDTPPTQAGCQCSNLLLPVGFDSLLCPETISNITFNYVQDHLTYTSFSAVLQFIHLMTSLNQAEVRPCQKGCQNM